MRYRSPLSLHFLKTTLALLSSALVANCAAPRTTLNSDLIREKFGNYGVQVLAQSNQLRVSNLYSGSGSDRITRTFAVVSFNGHLPQSLLDPHQQILAGGSLGSTLVSNGWTLEKRTLQHTLTPATPRLARMMQIPVGTDLATHLYALSAAADGVHAHYALINEIHHPAHLSKDELKSLFPAGPETPIQNSAEQPVSLQQRLTIIEQVRNELQQP